MSELGLDEIEALLAMPEKGEPHPVPEQTSHYVRWYDKEMRCLSRRCGSPTYIKVLGVSLCMTHTILKLTELLDDKHDQREIAA